MSEGEQVALVLSQAGLGAVIASITGGIINIILYGISSDLSTGMFGGFMLGGLTGSSIGVLLLVVLPRIKFSLNKRRLIKEFHKSIRNLINRTLQQLESIWYVKNKNIYLFRIYLFKLNFIIKINYNNKKNNTISMPESFYLGSEDKNKVEREKENIEELIKR